jgi:hypothetical protein
MRLIIRNWSEAFLKSTVDVVLLFIYILYTLWFSYFSNSPCIDYYTLFFITSQQIVNFCLFYMYLFLIAFYRTRLTETLKKNNIGEQQLGTFSQKRVCQT